MAFFMSPGVLVVETDLTNIIPAVATSAGGYAGVFAWGPVMDPTQITSENQLVSVFGRPNDRNAASFFTAADFLSYSNNLQVIRSDAPGLLNAVAEKTGSVVSVQITDGGSGYSADATVEFSAPQNPNGSVPIVSVRVDGAGVVEAIVVEHGGSGYTSAPTVSIVDATGTGAVLDASIIIGGVKIRNAEEYETVYSSGVGVFGQWAAKYPGSVGNSIRVEMADSATFADWDYKNEFDSAPSTSENVGALGGSNDELHILVIDYDGKLTGVRGTVIEKYAYLSKSAESRRSDGSNNYYKDVINNNSKYVWWLSHPVTGVGTSWGGTNFDNYASLVSVSSHILSGGADDFAPTNGQIQDAFSIFENSETYDVSLIPTGPVSPSVAKYVIENVAEKRKDCVVFVSPSTTEGGVILGNNIVEKTIAFREQSSFAVNSSYGFLDSGWKYRYDRYNDKYRWVPLNGDMAGLCARTDTTNDPWWSPGGLNRGQVKNVVKLNHNPSREERDELYKRNINPVVSFKGQGTVLYGDKTLLSRPSAFDRINVRRLFIVLEKAIATAAKYQLFEFNDSFTRAQFRAMVEPFLRDVQGRRGVVDFRVICDDTNNTGEVIDRNEFIADIYVRPNRSINFATLNMVAVRSGVSFEETGS